MRGRDRILTRCGGMMTQRLTLLRSEPKSQKEIALFSLISWGGKSPTVREMALESIHESAPFVPRLCHPPSFFAELWKMAGRSCHIVSLFTENPWVSTFLLRGRTTRLPFHSPPAWPWPRVLEKVCVLGTTAWKSSAAAVKYSFLFGKRCGVWISKWICSCDNQLSILHHDQMTFTFATQHLSLLFTIYASYNLLNEIIPPAGFLDDTNTWQENQLLPQLSHSPPHSLYQARNHSTSIKRTLSSTTLTLYSWIVSSVSFVQLSSGGSSWTIWILLTFLTLYPSPIS